MIYVMFHEFFNVLRRELLKYLVYCIYINIYMYIILLSFMHKIYTRFIIAQCSYAFSNDMSEEI